MENLSVDERDRLQGMAGRCLVARAVTDPDFASSLTDGHDGIMPCRESATHRIFASSAAETAALVLRRRPVDELTCPLGPLFFDVDKVS